ncbi:MAG: hypothetical protein ACLPSM_11310 [Acidimicrobiales bacterium]
MRSRRRLVAGLCLLGVAAISSWAVARTAAPSAALAGLAAVAGVVTFGFALSPALAGRRSRTMAAGLLLVGAAVVAGGSGQPTHGRVVFFVVSGVVLFCAAEFADRALSMPRQAEQRPGADHFSATWVIAVAVGSAAASYAVISARGVFEGGGPAALAVGTAAAVLVAGLAALLLRTSSRDGA